MEAKKTATGFRFSEDDKVFHISMRVIYFIGLAVINSMPSWEALGTEVLDLVDYDTLATGEESNEKYVRSEDLSPEIRGVLRTRLVQV